MSSDPVPHAMYQAVCDMLSDASRREIVLRAELVVAREENARLVENERIAENETLARIGREAERKAAE